MMMMWISRSVDLGKSEEMFCFLHVFSITCHKKSSPQKCAWTFANFFVCKVEQFSENQQLIGVVFENTKVFTTGTNRWDWHRTEHQQPTLEDGNLRWGEMASLQWSSIGRCGFLPTFYHVINKQFESYKSIRGHELNMIPLHDVGGFASYFGMMVWLVFQRLVTWYVNIMMYNGKMKTKLSYQKKVDM